MRMNFAFSCGTIIAIIVSLVCINVADAAPAAAEQDYRMNTNHDIDRQEVMHVLFDNKYEYDLTFCWISSEDDRKFCSIIEANTGRDMYSTVHHHWIVMKTIQSVDLKIINRVFEGSMSQFTTITSGNFVKDRIIGKFQVVGGQHVYDLKKFIENFEFYTGAFLSNSTESTSTSSHSVKRMEELKRREADIVRVRRPSLCISNGGYDCQGPSVSDAIRRAVFRRGHSALCFCGDYNYSSTFTRFVNNEEMPLILSSDRCNCDAPDIAHDMFMGCNWDVRDPNVISEIVDCDLLTNTHNKYQEELRLFLLHATTNVDMISMKHKLWTALINVFDFEIAQAVMPLNFNFIDNPEGINQFLSVVDHLIAEGKSQRQYFILKDVLMHRQYGITLTSAQKFKEDFIANQLSLETSVANIFLSDPYLINGYKLNMRRYMLLVCTGGRLRAYVHDDGKNIFTKLPYREPWVGEDDWRSDPLKLQQRLDELITTGYVPANHFDDNNLPLTGLEFEEYVRRNSSGAASADQLVQSMWARLALVVHAARTAGNADLCDVRWHTTLTSVPWCMHGAVRFQHFGCDFHIDKSLKGYDSRLFECNKGPDWSAHSFRDGTLKRDVAADIFTFIGFKGRFDGSAAAARANRLNLIYDSEHFDEGTVEELYSRLLDPNARNDVAFQVHSEDDEIEDTNDVSEYEDKEL